MRSNYCGLNVIWARFGYKICKKIQHLLIFECCMMQLSIHTLASNLIKKLFTNLPSPKLLKSITNMSYQTSASSANMSKRIAVCQMTSVADKDENLKVISDLVRKAATDNVQMVFFPEACDYIAENKKDTVRFSEPILTGNTVRKYRELAAKHNVWLSMGGVHEKDETNPTKVYNTHIIIDNKGDIVQTYRKLHLFDVEIPEKGVRLKESDYCNAGEHIVTPVDTPVGRLGLSICYDMRFPELSTALSILRAEILTYPSAFTQATGAAHWHVLLRARAIENQCYVISAAQVGTHNPKRKTYGHAMCVDPWGEIIVDCLEESPSYKVAEISMEKLEDVRRNMPVFQHKRTEVYSLHPLSIRKSPLPEHIDSASPVPAETQTPDRESTGSCLVFGHVRVPETCVFYKTKLSYAFVNLRCVTPGHVLVAPIREAQRNQDLTTEEAEDFYRTIRIVQKLMEKVHNTSSCTVTIQDGPDAGQTVKHLHCHIMPRKKGDFIEKGRIYVELAKHDQFKTGHPAKPPRTRDEMECEADMLRKEMEILLKKEAELKV